MSYVVAGAGYGKNGLGAGFINPLFAGGSTWVPPPTVVSDKPTIRELTAMQTSRPSVTDTQWFKDAMAEQVRATEKAAFDAQVLQDQLAAQAAQAAQAQRDAQAKMDADFASSTQAMKDRMAAQLAQAKADAQALQDALLKQSTVVTQTKDDVKMTAKAVAASGGSKTLYIAGGVGAVAVLGLVGYLASRKKRK